MYSEIASGATNALTQMGSAFAQKSEGRKIRRDSEKLQREFAQNGLSWKIADAYRNKDKIHPLVSMGANVMSASPSQVGVPDKVTSNFQPGAFQKTPKKAGLTEIEQAQLRGLNIANEKAQLELDRMGQPAQTPPVPNTIQVPNEITKHHDGQTYGSKAFNDWYEQDGEMVKYPSKDASEPLEGALVKSGQYNFQIIKDYITDGLYSTGNRAEIKQAFIKLKKLQQQAYKSQPPKPGYKYEYNWKTGNFKIKKKRFPGDNSPLPASAMKKLNTVDYRKGVNKNKDPWAGKFIRNTPPQKYKTKWSR